MTDRWPMHLIDKPFDSHRTSRRSLIVGLSAATMAAPAAASAAATGLPRGRSDETGDGSRGIACGQGAVSLSRSEAGELSSSDSITVSRPGLGSVAMDFDGDAGVESGARAAWTGAPSAARLRLSRATPDAGGATHFMLIPYRYGMALEYPGVLEAWVAEFSVHNHVNAIADSGARMWVGNHNDTGGLRMTAHRRDGVMYAELSSELFDRSSGGDMRFVVRRPPDDHWSFMSGGLSAEREVARIGGEGDVTARVASAARVVVGATGPGGRAGIVFGANGDTGIYRAAADVLRTDDNLQAQGDVIANAGQHGQIQ